VRYYLIAGERSGDLHGSNLIKALRKQDHTAVFQGFGGDYMREAGMNLIVNYQQMAFMGFVAVIANLGTISRLLKKCKKDIQTFKPDVIILIDYAGFNMRIAKFAKQNNLKVFYYISPKVWAWNTKRAWKLKANVDKLFSILPFEKEFFKKFDWEVDYVGNPVLDAVKNFQPNQEFLKRNGLENSKKIVALLPGSRKMELKRMIPVMAEVANLNKDYQYVVAAVKTLPEKLYAPLKAIPSVKFVYDSTYDLLHNATAAIVTSGTATLETGLFKVPQVVIYAAGDLEYSLLKRLVKVNYISLINLIANKPVIKELIQHEMNLINIDWELKLLIENPDYRQEMLNDYDEIYSTLDIGSASENAARLMVKFLSHYSLGSNAKSKT
jgi:lipid-A-disaccharide synthase